MKKQFLLLLVVCLSFTVLAQSPKRELRATWLTTVWGIDWPKTQIPASTGSNSTARQQAIQMQKNELNVILDSLKQARMNALFFQVRGFSDAYYNSPYEPWGQYLTGQRGQDPGYDPLAYAIQAAHERGIELHAWLNPFRYSSSSSNYGTLSTDYSRTHPDWIMNYGSDAAILNPGIASVREQIKLVVADIVNRYDVDGIVFDDYFYAYGGTNSALDSAAQRLYKPSAMSLGDWRRWNVNRMIEGVYDTIQHLKPYVTFGVSPFGTWTTSEQVASDRGVILPAGIGQTGDMYAEIYCDPLAWLEEGTVDYLSPQLYWTTYSSYSYAKLAPWWADLCNRFGKHFFSSHSVSSLSASAPIKNLQKASVSTLEEELYICTKAKAPQFASSEIGLQVNYNRQSDANDGPGSVFYNTNKTINTGKFINYLRTSVFTQEALVPELYWKPAPELPMVSNMLLSGQTLSWSSVDSMAKYAIYVIPTAHRNDADIFSNSNYLLGITYSTSYTLPSYVNSGSHAIAVSPLDRYNHEFTPRFYNESVGANSATTLAYPADQSNALLPCTFVWHRVVGATKYIWQLSTDSSFATLTASRECNDTTFLSTVINHLETNVTYYWRVKPIVANSICNWSSSFTFVSSLFGITSPVNGAVNVSLQPTIQWPNAGLNASYVLQISKNLKFADSQMVFADTLSTNSCTIPANVLESYTTFYARVIATYSGVTTTSSTTMFTTEDNVIGVPQILTPLNESSLCGDSIQVTWLEQLANGFSIELSSYESFPPRGTTKVTVGVGVFAYTYQNLTPGEYYIRVKAQTKDGWTDASEVIKVYLSNSVDVNNPNLTQAPYSFVQNVNEVKLHFNVTSAESIMVDLCNELGIIFERKGKNSLLLNEELTFSTSQLPSGTYFIRIHYKGTVSTLKFIKKL